MSEFEEAKKRRLEDEAEAHRIDIEFRNKLVLSVHPHSIFCAHCDAFCEGKTRAEGLALAAKRQWEEPVPGKFVCRLCGGARWMDEDYY